MCPQPSAPELGAPSRPPVVCRTASLLLTLRVMSEVSCVSITCFFQLQFNRTLCVAILDLRCECPWFPHVSGGIKWDPDCSEVQSSGNSKCAKSVSAGNNVHWEQGGGWLETGQQGFFGGTRDCRANVPCTSSEQLPCELLAPV